MPVPTGATSTDRIVGLLASQAMRAAWPLALVLLALALTLPRLSTPRVYVFDELYYAYTAGQLVAGEDIYDSRIPPRDDPAIEWTHPPLAKLLIAGGILVAGDNPVGWRLVSVLFGAAGVVIVYILALALTGNRLTSALAASLLLVDGLYFIESRLGMSNLFMLVLSSGALLAFWHVLTRPPARAAGPLLATGLLLGLALATKWSAVALAGLIGLAVLWRSLILWHQSAVAGPITPERWREPRVFTLWAAVGLILLPITVYLLSFSHFFLTGHTWSDFVAQHQAMFAYHRELGVVHSDSSAWWQWPLALQPVWYFVDEGRRVGRYIIANGNVLLFWPMVPAVVWVAIDWWGRRPLALAVLLIGFFGQWLPWALSPRGTFVYHLMPAVPLGCIALAVLVSGAWQRGGAWRIGAAAYVLAVVATFAFFYPVLTAAPISPDALNLRLWLSSWR